MKRPLALTSLLIVLALIGVGIYWFQSVERKGEQPGASTSAVSGFTKALATGPLAGFLVHEGRRPVAPFTFTGASGETLSLDGWKGKVVLLNLWATWCAPCRKEMPDLAKLQQQMGGTDFEVVALSLDRKGLEASGAFLKEIGADSLKLYVEPEGKSLAALQALGLPATVLIDRQGREAGRLLGPADWSSPEAHALVQALLNEMP
jgi:thiol-disulfide isomerase/thioredoxin